MEHRHYTSSRGRQQDPKERLQQQLLLLQQSQRIAQRARLDQIKIDELEKRLISVSDMDSIMIDLGGAISSRLRAFPARMMERLKPHIRPESHDELYAILTAEADSWLEELKTMDSGIPVIGDDPEEPFNGFSDTDEA
jgi:hypothetical protein